MVTTGWGEREEWVGVGEHEEEGEQVLSHTTTEKSLIDVNKMIVKH